MTADGTVDIVGDQQLLRFERRLAHPVERVWAAITEPAELEKWLARASVQLVPGGTIRLQWLNTDTEGNHAVMTAFVTEIDPPYLLEYQATSTACCAGNCTATATARCCCSP